VLVLAVAGALLAAAGQANAEDVQRLLRAGVKLRQQGRDREALATFQRAGEIQRLPRVVAQIGLAEQALGLWPAAAEHVEEALAATSDEWIQKNRRALEQAFENIKGQVGRLEVWGSPDGAEVLVDGRSLGRLPGVKPLWVGVDPVRVTVRAGGFTKAVRTVAVPAGDLRREHFALRSLSLAAPAATAVAADAGPAEGVRRRPVMEASTGDHDAEPASVTRRWWFWTAIAVVVVGTGVAVGVALSSRGGGLCDGVKGPCTVYAP
jgi:tetratricopeptide (TPR) repeat protein